MSLAVAKREYLEKNNVTLFKITRVCFSHDSSQWASVSSFARFLDYTQRSTLFGRNSLDELSVRNRDLYQTTHNIHNRKTSMPPVGFEITISAGKRQQTYALERTAIGIEQKLLQLGGKFSHQVHWLQLCQPVEASQEASRLPALQMVANFTGWPWQGRPTRWGQ